jgi:hypothetical protein
MILDNKIKTRLIITFITYIIFAFIFTKMSFFHVQDINQKKPNVDWLKVLLVAIIPSGLVFYISDSYVEKNGKMNFSSHEPTVLNESNFQSNSTPTLESKI